MIKNTNLNIKKMIFGFILLSLVFFTLFVPNKHSKEILAIILFIYTGISIIFIKKITKFSMHNKKVFTQMSVFALIYVGVLYFIGIYSGFYKNPVVSSIRVELKYVFISTIIIILSEVIRRLLVDKKQKGSTICTTIALIIVDVILYAQLYDITKLDDFLALLGLVIFASTAENLLFNYISVRFGHKPIIIYKLITVLYIYIAPILPEIYTYFRAIIRIIFPYFIFLFLENTYPTKQIIADRFTKSKRVISSAVIILIGISLALLISCKFYVGIIAVGSNSMKNAISKGDAVIFVKYKNQDLKIGDVIIFEKNDTKLIHRISNIEDVNNEIRYTTKGDNNNTNDLGFITNSDIIGISKLKLKYIGYPSILLGNFFDLIKR